MPIDAVHGTPVRWNVLIPMSGRVIGLRSPAAVVGWACEAREMGFSHSMSGCTYRFDDLKMLAPGIGIVDHIIQELRKSAQDTKAFIPEEWAALGRAIQGQIGEGNGNEAR